MDLNKLYYKYPRVLVSKAILFLVGVVTFSIAAATIAAVLVGGVVLTAQMAISSAALLSVAAFCLMFNIALNKAVKAAERARKRERSKMGISIAFPRNGTFEDRET